MIGSASHCRNLVWGSPDPPWGATAVLCRNLGSCGLVRKNHSNTPFLGLLPVVRQSLELGGGGRWVCSTEPQNLKTHTTSGQEGMDRASDWLQQAWPGRAWDAVPHRTRHCELLSGPPVFYTVCTVQPRITHFLISSASECFSPAKHKQAQAHFETVTHWAVCPASKAKAALPSGHCP